MKILRPVLRLAAQAGFGRRRPKNDVGKTLAGGFVSALWRRDVLVLKTLIRQWGLEAACRRHAALAMPAAALEAVL